MFCISFRVDSRRPTIDSSAEFSFPLTCAHLLHNYCQIAILRFQLQLNCLSALCACSISAFPSRLIDYLCSNRVATEQHLLPWPGWACRALRTFEYCLMLKLTSGLWQFRMRLCPVIRRGLAHIAIYIYVCHTHTHMHVSLLDSAT